MSAKEDGLSDSEVDSLSSNAISSIISLVRLSNIECPSDASLSSNSSNISTVKQRPKKVTTERENKSMTSNRNVTDYNERSSKVVLTNAPEQSTHSNRPVSNDVGLESVKNILEKNSSFLTDTKLIEDLMGFDNNIDIPMSSIKSTQYASGTTIETAKMNPLKVNDTIQMNSNCQFYTTEKRVTFDSSITNTPENHENDKFSSIPIDNPNILLRQLDHLRTELGNHESVGENSADNMKSVCQLLLAHLSAQRRRNKELEDELAKSQTSLAEMTEQGTLMKGVAENRAIQLKKAADQLGELHMQWEATYKKLNSDKLSLQQKYEALKSKYSKVQSEANTLQGELVRLRQLALDVDKLEKALDEKDGLILSSRMKNNELNEENIKVSKQISEITVKMNVLELEALPNMKEENDTLKQQLETANQKLVSYENKLSNLHETLNLLETQHKLLTNKYVQEEELKEKAIKDMDSLKKKTGDVESKLGSVHEELHQFYQQKLNEAIAQRDSVFKIKMKNIESAMSNKFLNKIDLLREQHKNEMSETLNRQESKLHEAIRDKQHELDNLNGQISKYKQENIILKRQQENVIAAVSAILTPSSTPHVKDQYDLNQNGVEGLTSIVNCVLSSGASTHRTGEQLNQDIQHLNLEGNQNARSSNSSNADSAENLDTVRENIKSTISSGPEATSAYISHKKSPLKTSNRENILSNPKAYSISPRKTNVKNNKMVVNSYTNKRIWRASEIINSLDELSDSSFEDKKSHSLYLTSNEKEVELEVPTRDTSLDYDAASSTLDKINDLSHLLSRYVKDAE